MNNRICMVTGATSGIGLVTARALAQRGATVIVAGRDPEKGAATVARIQQETGNRAVELMLADLSVQDQVRQMAREFQQRHSRLDVLVNNAGAFFWRRRLSADGIEMTFAVNHLSVFLLTNLLLDTLKASAPARIVNVSSTSHRSAHIDFDDLEGRHQYRGMAAYGRSKLVLLLFTYELARRLQGTQVTVNALHPGFVATRIGQNNGWPFKLASPLLKLIARSPEEGAQTSIYLATSPEVEGVSGQYFVDARAVPSAPTSYDKTAAQRLWEISAAMTGLDAAAIPTA
jgi:NAD(P)-dependent dehydrogenase (short-subunit alcohol dehydrogenase family)